MANGTLNYKLNNGCLSLVKPDPYKEVIQSLPLYQSYIIDIPTIKRTLKYKFKTMHLSVAPMPILGTVGIGSGGGVFWEAFLTYIFPWMLDIAKVLCAIKIAQAFYQEKRGGRDEGTGMGALVQYGKWYLIFWLIPWGVELIDQIGEKMFKDLQSKPLS